jgi:hypothetical protein
VDYALRRRYALRMSYTGHRPDRGLGGGAPGTPCDPEAFGLGVRHVAQSDGTLPALVRLVRRELPDHEREVLQYQLGVPKLGITVPPEFLED